MRIKINAAAQSSFGSDDAYKEAQDLLIEHDISEVRTFLCNTDKKIEECNTTLKQVIGNSYRDLIAACDRIMGMDRTCRDIIKLKSRGCSMESPLERHNNGNDERLTPRITDKIDPSNMPQKLPKSLNFCIFSLLHNDFVALNAMIDVNKLYEASFLLQRMKFFSRQGKFSDIEGGKPYSAKKMDWLLRSLERRIILTMNDYLLKEAEVAAFSTLENIRTHKMAELGSSRREHFLEMLGQYDRALNSLKPSSTFLLNTLIGSQLAQRRSFLDLRTAIHDTFSAKPKVFELFFQSESDAKNCILDSCGVFLLMIEAFIRKNEVEFITKAEKPENTGNRDKDGAKIKNMMEHSDIKLSSHHLLCTMDFQVDWSVSTLALYSLLTMEYFYSSVCEYFASFQGLGDVSATKPTPEGKDEHTNVKAGDYISNMEQVNTILTEETFLDYSFLSTNVDDSRSVIRSLQEYEQHIKWSSVHANTHDQGEPTGETTEGHEALGKSSPFLLRSPLMKDEGRDSECGSFYRKINSIKEAYLEELTKVVCGYHKLDKSAISIPKHQISALVNKSGSIAGIREERYAELLIQYQVNVLEPFINFLFTSFCRDPRIISTYLSYVNEFYRPADPHNRNFILDSVANIHSWKSAIEKAANKSLANSFKEAFDRCARIQNWIIKKIRRDASGVPDTIAEFASVPTNEISGEPPEQRADGNKSSAVIPCSSLSTFPLFFESQGRFQNLKWVYRFRKIVEKFLAKNGENLQLQRKRQGTSLSSNTYINDEWYARQVTFFFNRGSCKSQNEVKDESFLFSSEINMENLWTLHEGIFSPQNSSFSEIGNARDSSEDNYQILVSDIANVIEKDYYHQKETDVSLMENSADLLQLYEATTLYLAEATQMTFQKTSTELVLPYFIKWTQERLDEISSLRFDSDREEEIGRAHPILDQDYDQQYSRALFGYELGCLLEVLLRFFGKMKVLYSPSHGEPLLKKVDAEVLYQEILQKSISFHKIWVNDFLLDWKNSLNTIYMNKLLLCNNFIERMYENNLSSNRLYEVYDAILPTFRPLSLVGDNTDSILQRQQFLPFLTTLEFFSALMYIKGTLFKLGIIPISDDSAQRLEGRGEVRRRILESIYDSLLQLMCECVQQVVLKSLPRKEGKFFLPPEKVCFLNHSEIKREYTALIEDFVIQLYLDVLFLSKTTLFFSKHEQMEQSECKSSREKNLTEALANMKNLVESTRWSLIENPLEEIGTALAINSMHSFGFSVPPVVNKDSRKEYPYKVDSRPLTDLRYSAPHNQAQAKLVPEMPSEPTDRFSLLPMPAIVVPNSEFKSNEPKMFKELRGSSDLTEAKNHSNKSIWQFPVGSLTTRSNAIRQDNSEEKKIARSWNELWGGFSY